MRKFLLLLVAVMILVPNVYAAENFYGVLTIDHYNVKGCEIVEIGSMNSYTQGFVNYQREDFNNEKNFTKLLFDSPEDLTDAMVKNAKDKGYNVILGFRLTPMISYNGYGSSVVNGIIGEGVGAIRVSGTPARITCK